MIRRKVRKNSISAPMLGAVSFGPPHWVPYAFDEKSPSLGVTKTEVSGDFIKATKTADDSLKSVIVVETDRKVSIVRIMQSIRSFLKPNLDQSCAPENQSNMSGAAIFKAVDSSLACIGRPYIDLLQVHRFDPVVAPEETMKALHDVVLSGKVRYISASSLSCWQFSMLNEVAEKNGWTKFVSLQDEHSLLFRKERGNLDNIPHVAASDLLATGAFARPSSTETTWPDDSTEDISFDGDETNINRVEGERFAKRRISSTWLRRSWMSSQFRSWRRALLRESGRNSGSPNASLCSDHSTWSSDSHSFSSEKANFGQHDWLD